MLCEPKTLYPSQLTDYKQPQYSHVMNPQQIKSAFLLLCVLSHFNASPLLMLLCLGFIVCTTGVAASLRNYLELCLV